MKIEKIGYDWYQAQFSFKTKYKTIAIATGYGKTATIALDNCFRDYQSIIIL